MTYEDYLHLARTVAREAFAARFPHPFLVCDRAPRDTEVGFSTQLMDLKSLRFDEPGEGDAAKEPTGPPPRGVYAVVKSDRNPYADRISVGRASNCDVVLTTRKVSKLHAHLIGDDGRWKVADAKSTNGTWLGAHKLGESESVALEPGDDLKFGLLEMRFLDAAQLYDWLHV